MPVSGIAAYLAGQVSQLKDADITTQTQDAFAKIDALHSQNGKRTSQVIVAQIWFRSISDYNAVNTVGDTWICPASASVCLCMQSPMAHTITRAKCW